MANKTKNAKAIVAMFRKSTSGKSYTQIAGSEIYLVTPELYEMCKNKEVSQVEFVEGSKFTTTGENPMELTQWSAVDFSDSKIVTMREQLEVAKLSKELKEFSPEEMAAAGFE